MCNQALKNWIPYKLVDNADGISCHWLNTFSILFTDPFFEDTIQKCNSARADHRFRSVSDLKMVELWAADLPAVEPKAIIFHISRCGSTLVSQLMATLPGHIVLSEVPLFDQILRLHFKHTGFDEPETNALLTAAIKLYGQNKTGEEHGNLIIKADCWHLFFYEQLRRLYPETPFVIIYRSPDAVFHSHRKMPGLHTIPHLIETVLFGFEPGSPVFENLEAYRAAVIEAYLKEAFKVAEVDDNILLVNYIDGPMTMINKITSFTGTSLSPQQLEMMEERSLYHSKKPEVRFSEEGVNDILPVLYGAMEAYEKLDKKRTAAISI